MYKLPTVLILILIPLSTLAEEKKPEFTDDQLNRLQAAEEKYKDNPEITNLIGRLKDQYGLNEEADEKQPPPEPVSQEPSLQGDRNVAEQAYKNRDYSTAMEHYKALAAEGDAEASLKLGTMYEMGQGADKDSAAAHAWYKKAADEGDQRAKMFLKSIEKTSMTDEDLSKSEETYKEISKKPGDETAVIGDTETAKSLSDFYQLLPGAVSGIQTHETSMGESREAGFSPGKFNPEHSRPAINGEHLQPNKFNRQITPETTGDS